MRKQGKTTRALWTALLAVALASFGIAGTAHAKLTGEFEKFKYCPWKTEEVKKCLYAVTKGGEVVLGTKKVPIEKEVVLQGGFGKPNKETKISKFFGATEGKPTLVPVSQNVPGGLAGVVPEEKQSWLVKRLIKFFFENSLTGLGSTLELAKPASEIQISESFLSRKENVALKLPLKVHLENPFLGSKCFVGSESNPIIWNLTTGKTSPPEPNKPIEGSAGQIEFHHEGEILELQNDKMVDNAWAAPAATGCGGLIAFLVNPIVNSSAGLPSAAGHNTAILENTIYITTPAALKFEDETHP